MERLHTGFALALHAELSGRDPAGNLAWSPYSVASALGLAAAGARGRTRDELAAALAPGGSLADPLAELGRMLAAAAAPAEADAAVANALWMDQHLRFRTGYQQAVLGWPGGGLHTVDFRDDPEGSRNKINDDVAGATRRLIRDLLEPGTVDEETATVLVNALYLKVAWLHPFPAAATTPAPFHAPSGTRRVPTMRLRERLRYAATGGWRMVSLPTGGDVIVDVLLPESDPGPLAVPALPGVATLLALRGALRPATVDLSLPRFRVETGAELNPYLRRLGVDAAFRRGVADFSGMVEDAEVFVDTVVHKAVLRLDEQGFEGAAATAVVMRLVSMELAPPVPFRVDRPFLLVVRHQPTGCVYFLAAVAEPAAADPGL